MHELAWAIRFFYGLLAVAFLVNAVIAFAPRIKSHWRFHFAYSASILGIYDVYIWLRLAGVLDMSDFVSLVRWITPLLVIPLVMPALLIYWESTFYRRAIERNEQGECQT